jgi:hypothetical protein
MQLLNALVFTERRSGKTGNLYRAADVEAVVTMDDGTRRVCAFLLMAPRGEKGADLPAGDYSPVWETRIDRERRLTKEIVGFAPAKTMVVPSRAAA